MTFIILIFTIVNSINLLRVLLPSALRYTLNSTIRAYNVSLFRHMIEFSHRKLGSGKILSDSDNNSIPSRNHLNFENGQNLNPNSVRGEGWNLSESTVNYHKPSSRTPPVDQQISQLQTGMSEMRTFLPLTFTQQATITTTKGSPRGGFFRVQEPADTQVSEATKYLQLTIND